MALSGTINGSVTQKSNYFSFYMTWSATQSVSGNYSDVTVKTYWKTNNIYQDFDTVGSRNASITINGTKASISKVFAVYWNSVGNPYLIQTATQRVYHNSDGTKSITISARANGHAASYGPSSSTATSADCIASGTITLNTIPRASSLSISASSVNVGSSITATISRASSSFTHTVEFYINNSYKTTYSNNSIGYSGNTGTISFTIPVSWYKAMPSSTSCTAYCRITTYNGSTQIGGQVTKSFTVTVPSSITPTISSFTLNPADITINGTSYDYLIKGKNKLTLSASASAKTSGGIETGSPIKSYTFTGPSVSSGAITNSSTSISLVSSSGTLTYKVVVTDQRGRTASTTKNITCYDYYAPSFTTFNIDSRNGTSLTCTYKVACAPINNKNLTTIKIYAGGTLKKTITSVANGASGTTSISLDSATSTYSVYATITDSLGATSNSSTKTVFGASRILNITKDGTGIAFGKMAEKSELLDVRWPIKSGDPSGTMNNLSFRGTQVITGTSNDTTSNWAKQGNLATTYYNTTGQINDQPSQYGFLLNLTNGSNVHHIWTTQANGNIFHRGGNTNGWSGTWKTILDSSNCPNAMSTTLHSSAGQIGTITLSSSAANYTYLEIFYTDNNGRQPHSIKVYSPNGKYITLSCIEPSTTNDEPRAYIRTSGWTISGTTITPGRSDLNGANRGVYAQIYPDAGGVGTKVDTKVTANNYIKIYRVLGYK